MEGQRISYSEDNADYGGKERNSYDDHEKKLLLEIVATLENGKVKHRLFKHFSQTIPPPAVNQQVV